MEQDQFRVSFSLRSKILIIVVLLLIVVIGFLNFSGLALFTEDKRAYIYQSQSTEAALVAKEAFDITEQSFESLRTFLKSAQPNTSAQIQNKRLAKSILDQNQEISHLSAFLLNPKSGSLIPILGSKSNTEITGSIDKESIPLLYPMLFSRGYAFFNASTVEKGPRIGIILADLKYQNPSGKFVAIGLIPVKHLAKDVRGSQVSVTDSQGYILFDSNPEQLYQKGYLGKHPLFGASKQTKIAKGAMEYTHLDESFLGSYSKPGLGLTVLVQTPWKRAMRATYALTEKFLLLAGMAIGLAIFLSILFAKSLTAPVKRLYDATKEVAKGNFDLKLKTETSDEIGALSSSFNAMSNKILQLIEESKESVRIENEVAIASTVQQTLIPSGEFKNKNITINSHYESASECGGDWWGFFAVHNQVAIFIADATGHGLPSALLTASARSCFSVMQKIAEENPDAILGPADMLSYANRSIYDAAQGNIMMTFFGGLLDFETMTFRYASAGHNPPWLFQKGENGYQLKSLVSRGQRLGENREFREFEEKVVDVGVDDLLFLYTDGIMEGTNPDGTQYGKKAVRKIMQANASSHPGDIVTTLMNDFRQHNGEKPFDDDVTLAIARIHGGGNV